jgi:hypothetical protein
MEAPQTSLVLHLVHGTWGQRSDWTQDGSRFCRHMRAHLRSAVQFERFSWSGKNSHEDRIEAGSELATHLLSHFELQPDARHVVIAHSHGGNVALYAARHEQVAGRLAAIVCLATPFIACTPKKVPWPILLTYLSFALIPCVLLVSLAYALLAGSWLAVGILTPLLFASVWIWMKGDLKQMNQMVAERDALVSRLALPTTYMGPILCVRVLMDEARFHLFTWQSFAAAVWLPFSALAVILTAVLFFMACLSAYERDAEYFVFAALIWLCVVPVGYTVLLRAVWLIRGTRLVFGEKLLQCRLCYISARRWLPRATNVTRTTHLILSVPWLRGSVFHSAYEHRPVLEEITKWLNDRLSLSSAPAAPGKTSIGDMSTAAGQP